MSNKTAGEKGSLVALRNTILSHDEARNMALGILGEEFRTSEEYGCPVSGPIQELSRFIVCSNIDMVFKLCESPIERLFFGSLCLAFAADGPLMMVMVPTVPDFNSSDLLIYKLFPKLSEQAHVIPQVKLDVGGKSIRPDAIAYSPCGNKIPRPIVIECDGFEFHSGRDRFTADRQRDRILQGKGFDVLRYSGHEIYADPLGSVSTLFDRLFVPDGVDA